MRPLKVGLLVVFFFVLAIPVSAQTFVRIRVEHANSRVAPNSQATILAVLKRGDTFLVTGDVPYWYEVRLSDGRTAYVAKSLCEVMPPETEADSGETTGQGALSIYAIPPKGEMLTVEGCTPQSLVVNWSICPPEGKGGLNRLANVKKNRVNIPCSYKQMTVDQVLALKNLPRTVRTMDTNTAQRAYLDNFESRPVVVEGYLAMVKRAEKEGTNCDSSSRRDFHVELVPNNTEDPKTIRNEIVITEVTPWFSAAIPAWTVDKLAQYASYKGGYSGNEVHKPAKVRVYGWLFFDNWHASGSVRSWRGTAWEVHPVTRIDVFESGAWKTIQ